MARTATIRKEDIFSSAIDFVRKRGFALLSARSLAAKMKMSTQPIFSYFGSMEGLKQEVYEYVKGRYVEYIKEGLNNEKPFIGVSMAYINFARKEKEFYKLLFLTKQKDYVGGARFSLKISQDLISDYINKKFDIKLEVVDHYFQIIWLILSSIANQIVNDDWDHSDEEVIKVIEETGIAFYKAYKEIPGFADGTYNEPELIKYLISE